MVNTKLFLFFQEISSDSLHDLDTGPYSVINGDSCIDMLHTAFYASFVFYRRKKFMYGLYHFFFSMLYFFQLLSISLCYHLQSDDGRFIRSILFHNQLSFKSRLARKFTIGWTISRLRNKTINRISRIMHPVMIP